MMVPDGIIMLADMKAISPYPAKDIPKIHMTGTDYHRKLFTMGDNIGVSCVSGKLYPEKMPLSDLIGEFCRANTFNGPQDAAYALYTYIRKGGDVRHSPGDLEALYELDGEDQYIIHVAGYHKHNEKGLVAPAMYRICTIRSELKEGESKIEYKGDIGIMQCGYMRHINNFIEQINADKVFLRQCPLQDAVNASKYLFDATRAFEWLIDHINTISEEFEMIALTQDGIKWLRKHELEIKNNPEVKL
jgi:hypothetical protein